MRVVAMVLAALLICLGQARPALADAGVFAGNGQSLHQISSEAVQLVSIDVKITLGRGPLLFDGTVPGMDQAEYYCTFGLRNLTDKPVDVQVGFPVDSQFASGREQVSTKASKDWVLSYDFIARDDQATYHVDFVRREPKPSPGEYASLFVWRMHFGAKESRALTVQYRIPISMGLVETEKEERWSGGRRGFAAPGVLDVGTLELAGYITATGSSWAKQVETATFTIITEPFERYLNHRGWQDVWPDLTAEQSKGFLSAEQAQQLQTEVPVRHPWWFREITPAGWKAVEGGVQWQYSDFKPKDPINIAYSLTQFPRLPAEVASFVNGLRKVLPPGANARTELEAVREVLLATFGKEPGSATAKAFAAQQRWYSPRKDFSMADLDGAQQAVLKELDARLAEMK